MPSTHNEIWLKIDNEFFGLKPESNYEVSNCGQVRRILKNGFRNCTLWPRRGYLRVKLTSPLSVNGKYISVHKLVLYHFQGPKPIDDLVVNHIDGDKNNNSIANLEYITQAENNRHAAKVLKRSCGLRSPHYTTTEFTRRGIDSVKAKLDDEVVKEIRSLWKADNKTNTAIILSRRFNVHRNTIYGVVKNKFWKHVSQ